MAKRSLTPVSTLPERPPAPRGLPAVARKLWERVVLDYPPKHFTAANQALLEGFCRAWAQSVECDALISERGLLLPGNRANPAVMMRTAAWKELRAFATKLRLPISSLQRADSAKARPDERNALAKPWESAK